MSLQTGNRNKCENQPIRLMTTPIPEYSFVGHQPEWPTFMHVCFDFLFANEDIEIFCSLIEIEGSYLGVA